MIVIEKSIRFFKMILCQNIISLLANFKFSSFIHTYNASLYLISIWSICMHNIVILLPHCFFRFLKTSLFFETPSSKKQTDIQLEEILTRYCHKIKLVHWLISVEVVYLLIKSDTGSHSVSIPPAPWCYKVAPASEFLDIVRPAANLLTL